VVSTRRHLDVVRDHHAASARMAHVWQLQGGPVVAVEQLRAALAVHAPR
jgi:hypothetical protein